MLVLARQVDETVVIGDNIEVTIVAIRGDKVRLGINAPKSVTVHRKEVYDAIKEENGKAARLRPNDVIGLEKANRNGDCFLSAAIAEARLGLSEGGLPIGSVLVRNGQIIAHGHNRRVQKGDPMAHAEIDCLTQAGRQQTYKDTILYSTLMPCYLCSGAIVQFGIPKVIVGESANFPGGPDFLRSKGVEVIDLADPECIQMMGEFIKAHSDLWNEDIGK